MNIGLDCTLTIEEICDLVQQLFNPALRCTLVVRPWKLFLTNSDILG